MSDQTRWLGLATVAAISFAAATVIWTLFGDRHKPGCAGARRYVAWLDSRLEFLRSRLRGSQVLSAQVALGAVCSVAAIVAEVWPLALALPAVAAGPKVIVDVGARRRVARIEEQVEPWLNAVANALKASASLGEAMASSIGLVQAPMSEEIDVLIKEYELGTPLDRALGNLAERVGSKTLAGSVLALQVARKSGGNLPEMLANAANALRELARLEGVVRTKTAEGKAQAFVISAIPAFMVVLIHAIEPGFFRPLAETFLGNLIVGGASVLWVVAILAARKILAVEV